MTLVCNVEDITSTYDRFTKIPCNYSIKTHTLNIVCFPWYMTCNKLTKHSASVLKNASDPSATGGRTAWLRSARENLAAPRVSSGKIQKMLNVLSKHRYLESMVIDQWSIKYDDLTSKNDATLWFYQENVVVSPTEMRFCPTDMVIQLSRILF